MVRLYRTHAEIERIKAKMDRIHKDYLLSVRLNDRTGVHDVIDRLHSVAAETGLDVHPELKQAYQWLAAQPTPPCGQTLPSFFLSCSPQ